MKTKNILLIIIIASLIAISLLAISFKNRQKEPNPVTSWHSAYVPPERRDELIRKGNAGDAKSSSILFTYYEFAEEDNKKALYWLNKAAEQGDIDSQYNLGNMYTYVDGMIDKTKAIYWLKKAAKQNNALAIQRLKEIDSKIKE